MTIKCSAYGKRKYDHRYICCKTCKLVFEIKDETNKCPWCDTPIFHKQGRHCNNKEAWY